MMNSVIEWIVILYHVALLGTIVAVILDYTFATDKFMGLRDFIDENDDSLTPVFGFEIIIGLIAMFALITGFQFMWYIVQAVTLIILFFVVIGTALHFLTVFCEAVRQKRLDKK